MLAVDLHVHSNRSDGSFSPAQLVDYAREKGLAAFALTDHDTIDGLDEALQYAERLAAGQADSIAAAQAAYEKGEPWLEELRIYLDENFRLTGEYLRENLPKAKYLPSEATYLAWVDLKEYFEPDENLPLFFAYEAGVLLEGGNMFVQNSDGFIRLNLACPKATLKEGLRRICQAVNTRHAAK